MPRISQLPSLTAADNADEIAIVDVSASTTKKITRGDLLKAPLPNNSVTTAAIADGAVTSSKMDWATFVTTKKILTSKTGVVVSGAIADVTDYNISRTVLSGQEIEIEFYSPHAYSSTDAVRVDFHIVDDLGNIVQSSLFRMWTSTNGGNQLRITGRYKPTAGNRTWRLRVQQAGNTTVTLWAFTDSQFKAEGLIKASVVG